MFLLAVNYRQSAEKVYKHVDTHSAWIKKYLEEGVFVFAGPKKSKLGCVILVKSIDKCKLKEIINEDSYVQEDVAEYQVIDFDCKLTLSNFELLKSI